MSADSALEPSSSRTVAVAPTRCSRSPVERVRKNDAGRLIMCSRNPKVTRVSTRVRTCIKQMRAQDRGQRLERDQKAGPQRRHQQELAIRARQSLVHDQRGQHRHRDAEQPHQQRRDQRPPQHRSLGAQLDQQSKQPRRPAPPRLRSPGRL